MGLPLAFHAQAGGPAGSLLEAADEARSLLAEAGALLFRGWRVDRLEAFQQFVDHFAEGAPPFGYAGGASPREALGSGVYSSTEYPPEMTLALHNELSYADVHPRALFFFCLRRAKRGGETTLADSRRILERIDGQVVAEFRSKQVRYLRNLSPLKGSGYSWQEAFETDEPAEAEAQCRHIGAAFEWRDGGWLRISQTRPATAGHPETGEAVWFNQAHGFHPSALEPETYDALLAECGSEENFRLGVTFGDGTPIPVEALEHVRQVLREETVPHRWQQGDIVVIDNFLTAHGRMPFAGERKIALAMR